ncbi:OmpA family protein [Vibrio algivorus]|uniref:OmpA family protein n=1 Tax=Vibrio algivorus TaxID=1667024 RepID=A0A557PAV6_9VIBR|nr:OmpA family protein [Vibrio algivorus]TVO37805.1 OmpA family protein [Vibrio algivorus]
MLRVLVFISGALVLSGVPFYTMSAEANKSVGVKFDYNFAHSGCEDNNLDCDDQSFGGGVYFRHNIFDPYFYQISFDYLGQYKANYPALADPSQKAKYTGDIFGLGISAGRVFSLTENQSIVAQLGILPWYVDVEGHEIGEDVDNDKSGVSPFASLAYQYNMTEKSYLELGYQYTYGIGSDSTGGADLSQVFLGLGYRFGASEPETIVKTVTETKYVTVTEKSMTLNFGENNSTVLFAFDSAKLNPNMSSLLAPMEKRLKDNPNATLTIESHTDNVGSDDYNHQLSQRRGNALKGYFVEQGISDDRITVKAYGEAQPLVPNTSAENRATNRRVVLFSPPFEKQEVVNKEAQTQEQGAEI